MDTCRIAMTELRSLREVREIKDEAEPPTLQPDGWKNVRVTQGKIGLSETSIWRDMSLMKGEGLFSTVHLVAANQIRRSFALSYHPDRPYHSSVEQAVHHRRSSIIRFWVKYPSEHRIGMRLVSMCAAALYARPGVWDGRNWRAALLLCRVYAAGFYVFWRHVDGRAVEFNGGALRREKTRPHDSHFWCKKREKKTCSILGLRLTVQINFLVTVQPVVPQLTVTLIHLSSERPRIRYSPIANCINGKMSGYKLLVRRNYQQTDVARFAGYNLVASNELDGSNPYDEK
ncbi:hypothetical protein ACLOJK_012790 [Asimina triloba]